MTDLNGHSLDRKLRMAGGLILAGLLIQTATLIWNHPLSFIAFLCVGTPVVLAGIVVYLYSIVSAR